MSHNPLVVQRSGGLDLSVIPGHNEDEQLYLKRLPFYSGKTVCVKKPQRIVAGIAVMAGTHTYIHTRLSPV